MLIASIVIAAVSVGATFLLGTHANESQSSVLSEKRSLCIKIGLKCIVQLHTQKYVTVVLKLKIHRKLLNGKQFETYPWT
ncbi:uncharacterized protein MONOS_17402 [Monocercomonoides exilis]|uniref:uncharacterized protein n=1 Tax=Monocercomonoides exilis TaxID=2049356 RepID=UPI00355ACCA8|nr:hypothetical protein MONOS_17402 [Monocercomonoides exilis]